MQFAALNAAKLEQGLFFLNSCIFLAVIEEKEDLQIDYHTDYAKVIADKNPAICLDHLKNCFKLQNNPANSVSIY